MIFGMAEPFQHAIMQQGRRLRLYTPVGDLLPGMAYLVRRLLENTSNESFLRKEYVESQPLSTLLLHRSEGPTQKPPPRSEAAAFHNEPQRDFSQCRGRRPLQQSAIDARQTQLGPPVDFVAGGLHLTRAGLIDRTTRPVRMKSWAGCPDASSEDVEQAVQSGGSSTGFLARHAHRTASGHSAYGCGAHAGADAMSWRHGRSWSVASPGGRRMRISRKRSTFWNIMRRTGAHRSVRNG